MATITSVSCSFQSRLTPFVLSVNQSSESPVSLGSYSSPRIPFSISFLPTPHFGCVLAMVEISLSTSAGLAKQLSAGTSYRHYFGERGWAAEPAYSLMTESGHQDHMLALNVVKDLTRPSRKAVLYTLMGGGIYAHRKDGPYPSDMGINLGWGMGLKVWARDRFFIAPQFRIGEPFKFSIHFGLARRR